MDWRVVERLRLSLTLRLMLRAPEVLSQLFPLPPQYAPRHRLVVALLTSPLMSLDMCIITRIQGLFRFAPWGVCVVFFVGDAHEA
jgi:hypothetical protein